MNDDLWYKDAVIYQLHVKAFYDSDGDGTGDFRGLIEKLQYVKDLGATAIWLLPFYPSPMRDDGYDVSDYRGVHHAYGTMRDARAFIHAAHEHGLRVIADFVVNHTSDQHPWFQRARRSQPGSVWRDLYVWSDTPERYGGTRIIFTDTESSNWAWDPVAKAYYWHRFFSHQPELNFDNPRVFVAIAGVMRFWFDAGIDGLRLDAVPYLCEREGTSNENLPETHAVIKRLRALVDAEYPGRVLLAEANQWPEDVRPYFGDGDECHMAFHFPLMPRMFASIALEDRYPMYDIMRQTPTIPENAQWAIFLRNHDEMTLEMVTETERAFLYSVYASDKRARLNVGIRRRLAPLLDNDRRRIELMTSLLLSMPGTPVVYYGDEIGMGDNIYLRDRDGVRTPMQWSPDRNGGFSRADAQRLYLPAIQDPVYGFAGVNVEAQVRSESSLLNWMRRIVSVRQAGRVFGRGTLTFLYPKNRHVAAYVREYEGETVLCVANLAHSSQATTLDLSRFAGRTPVEMLDWSAFPPIGADNYVLTLPGFAFYWFALTERAPARVEPSVTMPLPEFVTLVLPTGTRGLANRIARTTLERDVLPPYLAAQAWTRPSERGVTAARILDGVPLGSELDAPLLSIVETLRGDEAVASYVLPVGLAWESSSEPGTIARTAFARARTGARGGYLFDATAEDRFWLRIVEAVRGSARLEGACGNFVFAPTWSLDALAVSERPEVRRIADERTDDARVVGNEIVLKLYRRLEAGVHPEIEMGRRLHDANFANAPPLLGTIEYQSDDGVRTALGVAHRFVENQGDAWHATLRYLERFLERRRTMAPEVEHDPSSADEYEVYERSARALGETLASLHRTLAQPTDDPAFAPEAFSNDDLIALAQHLHARAEVGLDALEAAAGDVLPAAQRDDARALLAQREVLHERIDALSGTSRLGRKTRVHGRFNLSNVLVVRQQFLIVGFDGDPRKTLAERRAKTSPLDDVALLLQSFDYAVKATLFGLAVDRTEDLRRFEPDVELWRRRSAAAFLEAYAAASDEPLATDLLGLFVIRQALYALSYELANRPSWIAIPLRSLGAIVASEGVVSA